MTFAHQNIERLPVPFVDNPFPATKAEPVSKNKSKQPDDAIQAAARPKTLSKPTEEFLRELEQIMRRARPVSGAEIVAGPAIWRSPELIEFGTPKCFARCRR